MGEKRTRECSCAIAPVSYTHLGYGRFAGVAVGYALFETCWAAGLFVPMFASQDYYRELRCV